MLIAGFFEWWYGVGWLTLMRKVTLATQNILRFFSVGELARSLFAPFRQISAGHVQGPLGIQLRAFGDRVFSRLFGAFIRTMLIIFGLIVTAVYGMFAVVMLIMWPLIIFLPLIGLVLMLNGYFI